MKVLTITFAACLLAAPAGAADHRVLMLNYGKDGGMVFEPGYVKAEPGDTITFVPENSGHYVQSYVVPEGATPWKSKLDEKFTINVENEGVYLYICPPHLMMSMIGVVQVGKPVNLDEVKKKSERLRSKLIMKSGRLDEYLGQISN